MLTPRGIDLMCRSRYHWRMPQCRNCQSSLEGAYCTTCGQRDIDLERPIGSLVRDVLKEAFEVDGRLAVTLKTLFRSPGKLTSEFLAGRRRTYTSPLRIYLGISISFFVLAAWAAGSGILLDPGQDPRFDAAVQARFLSDDLPRLMFVLLPMFALLMKVVYRQRLYFDHLIFSLHLHTAAYVILAMMMPLEALASRHPIPVLIQFALLGYLLAYFVMALRRVYSSGWLTVALKSTVVLLVYGVLLSVAIENTSNFLIIAD
ncbi:MAG: DUF3667 domain-containing protein [Woeseiaceae bacterium]